MASTTAKLEAHERAIAEDAARRSVDVALIQINRYLGDLDNMQWRRNAHIDDASLAEAKDLLQAMAQAALTAMGHVRQIEEARK